MPVMNDAEVAISARGVSKEYNHRPVLRSIDLAVRPGESVGLIGTNGAGKTTLLRCLASLARPTDGEIQWFGQPVRRCPAHRRLVAMVAHETRLYPELSLRENLVFAARMHRVSQPHQRAQHWLRQIELAAFGDYRPNQISKGMRQRMAVARALIHDPKILLFDEPFSGLDQSGKGWLTDLLQRAIRDGCALCFASHDLPMTEQLSHRILRLESGRLQECRKARDGAKTFPAQGNHAA